MGLTSLLSHAICVGVAGAIIAFIYFSNPYRYIVTVDNPPPSLAAKVIGAILSGLLCGGAWYIHGCLFSS
jgi:hypothetical protein